MGEWLDTKPEWWPVIKEFATGPRVFILSKVMAFLVDVVLDITDVFSNTILTIYDVVIVATVEPIAAALIPFSVSGNIIETFVREISMEMISLSVALGPFAPYVIYPLWAAIAYVVGWLLVKAGRWAFFAVVTRL